MTKGRRLWRLAWLAVGGAAAVVLGLAALGALSNRGLPTRSAVVDRLSDLDEARLAEALHVKRELGESVWPGWGVADVPVILYNESDAFLVGLRDPAPGWVKVPGSSVRGGPWVPVPDGTFEGQTYYRQRLPESGQTPEAFTVRVGDRYVASFQTMDWLRIGLTRKMQGDLPPFVRSVFPYRLALGFLVGGTEGYVSLVLHESFHAYQGSVAPDRLAAAERATALEAEYDAHAPAMQAAWRDEMRLLATAISSGPSEGVANLARRFLADRQQRRAAAGLAPALVEYEREREWLEGVAKYVQIEVWRTASVTMTYQPLPAVRKDPRFGGYTTFQAKWSRELGQLARSDPGETGFYSSGMAQGLLLDRLMPSWKTKALGDGVWLEDLVADAVAAPGRSQTERRTK